MIPLYHDFTGETVLVFGGGPVGARKARRFVREAAVVVVSPAFSEADYGAAQRVRASPSPDDVDSWIDRVDPALVVAATDDEDVNEAVERAASERGVLVNRADRAGGRDVGSVVVPATVRDGDVVVSVSTSGSSPALSRELRSRIESEVRGAGEMASLTADVREELKASGVEPAARRAAIRELVRSEWVWKGLGTGSAKARRRADAVVEAALGEHE